MIGTSINNSLTLTGIAAADIAGGAGKAVKYDENGKIVLCNNTGEPMLGILILQTAETVQILRSGYYEYVADACQHKHRYRIINHRLIIDRQKLLAHAFGYGIETGSAPARQNYAFHISQSFMHAPKQREIQK